MARLPNNRKAQSSSAVREQAATFKRERILEEATLLFYEIGYGLTTLDAVADRLQVKKPFIYYYFSNKAEILEEIGLRGIEQANAALDEALAGEGSPTERLWEAARAVTRTVLAVQRGTAVFFREEKHLSPATKAKTDKLRKDFDRKLARLLSQGVKRGEFVLSDPNIASRAIGGMISWSFTWFNPEGRLTIEQISHEMGVLALNMVGVRKLP